VIEFDIRSSRRWTPPDDDAGCDETAAIVERVRAGNVHEDELTSRITEGLV